MEDRDFRLRVGETNKSISLTVKSVIDNIKLSISASDYVVFLKQIKRYLDMVIDKVGICSGIFSSVQQIFSDCQGLKNDLENYCYEELNVHMEDMNNPHSVTAEQVDAYTKTQTDSLLDQKQPVGNYLTEHQSLSNYYTKSEVDTELGGKSDTNHTHSQYLTSHQDISGKANSSDLASVATSGDYDDLTNKPTIPAAQVNSDWNASSGVAQILNKPTIPTVPTNVSAFTNDAGYLTSHQDISGKVDVSDLPTKLSDLTDDLGSSPTHTHSQYLTSHQDISGKADVNHIHNQYLTSHQSLSNYYTKSETYSQSEVDSIVTQIESGQAMLADVALSGDYDDLTNKPTIPAAQVNSDWNASSGVAQILNKPTIPTVPNTLSSFTDDLGTSPTHTHSQYLTSHQDISGKANTDLSNCTKPYVTSTYHSGSSWYRVWSDGFIEQGGYISSGSVSDSRQISLNKTMSSSTYFVICSTNTAVSGTSNTSNREVSRICGRVISRATNSFNIQNNAGDFYWYACGY